MKICKDGRIWGQINTDYFNPEYIKKQRKAKLGKNNPNWKGGISLFPSQPRSHFKKGWNPKSGINTRFKKGHLPTKGCFPKGEKHPSWKDGITSLRKQIYKLYEYKQWRSDVFQRDNWICQTCGEKGKGNLEAHHIKAFSQILKVNCITNIREAQRCKELWNIDNGITLCKECHKLTYNYRKGVR